MSQCVEIGGAGAVAHPKPFLTSPFKPGVISLALGTQGIGALKAKTAPVNRKAVVAWKGYVFGAAAVFLPIVPAFVAAGTDSGFRFPERTAELLARPAIVGSLPVLIHSKASRTDRVTNWQLLRAPGVAFVERYESLAVIDVLDQVVDFLCVITLITQKSTRPNRQNIIGVTEDILNDRSIGNVGGSGQLVKGKS